MGRETSESDSELSSCGIVGEGSIDYTFGSKNENQRLQHKEKRHKCNYAGCNKSFYRPSKLAAHILLHENKRPYACKISGCGKAYSNSSHLKRHNQTSHTQSNVFTTYKCSEPGCDAVLKTKQVLMRHLKRKHIDFPFECLDCREKFKRNYQLKEHTFVHTGVHPYRCESCNQGFVKQYDLKRHKRSHRTYHCREQSCGETFTTMSQYRKHLSTVHRSDHLCAICDKKFSTHGNMKVHLSEQHFSSSTCWECSFNDCGLKFAQEKYLKQHMEHVHQKLHQYKCPVNGCEKILYWKKSLYKHVKMHNVKRVARPRKKQKERKDKGIPKKSMAAELANITLPLSYHKELIARETVDTDDSKSDISYVSEITAYPNNLNIKINL